MLPVSLGVAWLVLGPLALWLLLRGTWADRTAAVVTLALLEAGTIAMSALRPPPAPAHAGTAPATGAVAARPPATPPCRAHEPVPASAEVGRHLVLTWPAVSGECGSAEVVLLPRGKQLMIWVYAPPRAGRHPSRHAYTRPVHVRGGTASLAVPLHFKPGVTPVDGHSSRPIPAT
jgi:hypothetical protein